MTHTGKTALILVWMGKLPSYFPLWTRTLSANRNYDFLLFTDQPAMTTADNLKIIRMSFDQVRAYIARQLALDAQLTHPYKLCDFKPAYGEIFREYLQGYSHWGCCDMDLLFGDLDTFITPELQNAYPKLFSRGHLTIYRNESSINTAWRRSTSIDAKKIMTSPEVYLFDEWSGIHRVFEELGLGQYNAEVMGDVRVHSSRVECTNIKNYRPQVFIWQNGRVKQYYIGADGQPASTELAYIHFQKRKIAIPDPTVYTSETMVLNPESVLPWSGTITTDFIRQFDRPGYAHYIGSIYKKLRKKLQTGSSLSINKSLIQAR